MNEQPSHADGNSGIQFALALDVWPLGLREQRYVLRRLFAALKAQEITS